jgi:putative exosortase-associated protein (TIGR04073 family)
MQTNAFRIFRVAACLLLTSCFLAAGIASVAAQDDEDTAVTGVQSYTFKHSQVVPTVLVAEPAVAPVSAKQGSATGSPMRDLMLLPKMTKKLFRGTANILFGWIEIPKNVIVEGVKTDPFTGTVSGTVLGFVKGFERTGVGFIEVFTFWHEWPKEYGPIIEPAYVLDDFDD